MTEEQGTLLRLIHAQTEVVEAFCNFCNSSTEEREKYSDILFDKLQAQHKVFTANQKAALEAVSRWEAGNE